MVMDPNTVRALAEIRQRLSQLESALGANTPDQAEQIVRRLANAVQQLRQDVADLQGGLSTGQDQLAQARTRIGQLATIVQTQQQAIATLQAQTATQQTTIDALVFWAQTVTPPFTPPGGTS